MLRPDRDIELVYLHRAPVDMRKQMDGLAVLAQDVIRQDPTSGALFVFTNARRNKLKILTWERNGFIVSAQLTTWSTATPGCDVGRMAILAFQGSTASKSSTVFRCGSRSNSNVR